MGSDDCVASDVETLMVGYGAGGLLHLAALGGAQERSAVPLREIRLEPNLQADARGEVGRLVELDALPQRDAGRGEPAQGPAEADDASFRSYAYTRDVVLGVRVGVVGGVLWRVLPRDPGEGSRHAPRWVALSPTAGGANISLGGSL